MIFGSEFFDMPLIQVLMHVRDSLDAEPWRGVTWLSARRRPMAPNQLSHIFIRLVNYFLEITAFLRSYFSGKSQFWSDKISDFLVPKTKRWKFFSNFSYHLMLNYFEHKGQIMSKGQKSLIFLLNNKTCFDFQNFFK